MVPAKHVTTWGHVKSGESRLPFKIRHRLMAPEVAAEAMRAFAEETNRLVCRERSILRADGG
jgi:hypothetical protein